MTTRRLRTDDLAALAVPEQPTLSPDGTQIAYVLRANDVRADRAVTSIWRVGVHSGLPTRLTRGPGDSAPAWSPDGTQLAFLRAQDGPPQVWLLPVSGGEPEPLVDLPAGAGAPLWSPDGTRIAFTAPVDPAADADPVVTARLNYQVDGVHAYRTTRAHLHVINVAGRTVRRLTEGDWTVNHLAWSPNSERLAFTAATTVDADVTLRVGVHVLSLADIPGKSLPDNGGTLVGLLDGFAGPMIWTADGSTLLVSGRIGTKMEPSHLLRVPLDGATVENVTQALDRSVRVDGPAALPALVDGGRSVLFCARDGGDDHLYAVEHLTGGVPRKVFGVAGTTVSGLATNGDTVVVVRATPTSFGEVAVVDLATGAETVRTDHGAALADVDLFPAVPRQFTISDGTTVSGWLIRDPSATGPGPLLLDIHGGPHTSWSVAASKTVMYHQELVALGWSVLLIDPRGSDGYGKAFYTAALGQWGTADAKDLLEPLDTLVAEGIADPARLAVAGYSYGGFMAAWLTAHDQRFAAAVLGAPVIDLASASGTSDVGHFLATQEFGGPPWQNTETARRHAPYTTVDQVTTPTLLVHGAADFRCPVGQSQQWFTALRQRGVPTELVIYPEASHLFITNGRVSHQVDFHRRVVDWIDRHAGVRRSRIDAAHWQRRLDILAERHDVPGAALGILRLVPDRPDELVEAAFGVLNTVTGVTTTTDSLFQIGSITKVWTATLAMQLVDEGLLDLDAPIVEILPELRLADLTTTKRVTARHLLNHTSGIDGDVFTDTGRGADCLAKYVAALAEIPRNHPIDATFSYSNSAYILLGRVIEKITGQTWDVALTDRLVAPLGLTHTTTLAEDAIRHRIAVGHTRHEDGGFGPVAKIWLPRSFGPAGIICASAADLLAFVRLHLTGGLTANGLRLLSAASAAAMTDGHAILPHYGTDPDSWGLGWQRFDWSGSRLIGHDGNTWGQSAFLRILPEAGLAVTLLTNGGEVDNLFDALCREIFPALTGVEPPPRFAPPTEPLALDISRHVGIYEHTGQRYEVIERDGGLVVRFVPTGAFADLSNQVFEYPLTPVDPDGNVFAAWDSESRSWVPLTFYELSSGEPYVHFYFRATPKVR